MLHETEKFELKAVLLIQFQAQGKRAKKPEPTKKPTKSKTTARPKPTQQPVRQGFRATNNQDNSDVRGHKGFNAVQKMKFRD